ncbi:hypothetical protein M472_10905 [Sphingobacterium paucimobilis HER1398]|uniref:Uncharacterized protein n=1 Tax=Sphingobacterium paucimobilis HER1398 TaxID=1346330 RepID=U2J9D9_9SPHI|nr:hypothetical protein M472_10905 [Sphingobacterium paucimobilis HER1398]
MIVPSFSFVKEGWIYEVILKDKASSIFFILKELIIFKTF